MSRLRVGLAVMALVLGRGASARAEETVVVPATAAAPAPCVSAPVVDVAAEQREFDRELELFAKRWEFTRRLVAEREERAFQDAEMRHERFFELTTKLAGAAVLEAERQFESAVELFVKKRELTRSLSAAAKASAPVAAPDPVAPGR